MDAGRRAVAGLLAGWTLAPRAAPAAEPVDETRLVRTGLYLVGGGGANTLLRLSAAGIIVVDAKGPDAHAALMQRIRRLNRLPDLPLRALVVSDHLPQHAGNAAAFLAAGAGVVAQANAARRLPAEVATAPRLLTYEREQPLRLGGVELRLLHFGPAHTDGDTVVHFADLRVVALGDLVGRGRPEPDADAGGSLAGWSSALGQVLELDFDIAIASSEPPLARADVAAFKETVDAALRQAGATSTRQS